MLYSQILGYLSLIFAVFESSKINYARCYWFFVTWYGSIGGHKSTKSLSGKRLN
ncbi:unknown protein [Microcystis aeruginosa NIES-843]|uniref:Uncharacterized protein n=1 Tax=Microcystis aeruginosa (strain NIES-843 / IAM M-2473) TaxID=449447 RepID=B0JWY1_MICAN|nr:unknown protein [Microcystis aeruginosa NIES-843]